jgi:single-stranded-DNA-specific exonuclease
VVYTTKEQENPFTEGIIGILAGRLAEEYKTPCIVLTETKDGILKGSARTYKDVNIKALLDASNKWLLKYGGHKGAAGMSLNISDVEKFKIDLQKAYNNQGYTFDENLYYDLDLNTANLKSIAEELEKFKPYGEGNPAPVFCGNLYLIPKAGKHYQLMGKNEEHIKLFAKDMSVLGFDLAEKFDKDDYPVNIKGVGNISYNHFGSEKNIQFELIDYEKGTSKPLTALSKSLSEKLKKL